MPVREAIGRLEQDGLVVRSPHRGAVVADLTPAELAHVYATRLLLEVEATRLGCARGRHRPTSRGCGPRTTGCAPRSPRAASARRSTATRSCSPCSTPRAATRCCVGLVEDLWQRCRAFKLLGADAGDSLAPDEGAWSTQRRLLDAVEAGDVEAAVAVTRESLESAQERIRGDAGRRRLRLRARRRRRPGERAGRSPEGGGQPSRSPGPSTTTTRTREDRGDDEPRDRPVEGEGLVRRVQAAVEEREHRARRSRRRPPRRRRPGGRRPRSSRAPPRRASGRRRSPCRPATGRARGGAARRASGRSG